MIEICYKISLKNCSQVMLIFAWCSTRGSELGPRWRVRAMGQLPGGWLGLKTPNVPEIESCIGNKEWKRSESTLNQ